MRKVVSVDPFRCRMWELHDRLEAYVTAETCSAEIESFEKHGQLVAALGRPLTDQGGFDVELICGARRLLVARLLKKPLLVELREMTDREAIVAIDIENRQRADVSAYERGLSFAQWLRSGHFTSQEEIVRVLRLSPAQVSRLLRLSRLPTVILKAFSTPTDIREGWGLDLLDALEDENRRQATINTARALAQATPRLPGKEVYRQLMAATRGRSARKRTRDEVVTDDVGQPLFRVRRQNRSLALLLPIDSISAEVEAEVRHAVRRTLQAARARAQTVGAVRSIQRSPVRPINSIGVRERNRKPSSEATPGT
jgi:ParB family transcriptional regulator, chromosome partitioning protein